MSTSDKAKEKLMAAMRMTKAGAEANADKPEVKESPAAQESKTVKQKKESVPEKKVIKETKPIAGNYIEPSRRIWPD